jgi:hypothetical protein
MFLCAGALPVTPRAKLGQKRACCVRIVPGLCFETEKWYEADYKTAGTLAGRIKDALVIMQ